LQDNLGSCIEYLKLANKQKLFIEQKYLNDFNNNEIFKKFTQEQTFKDISDIIKYGKK
jgi:hypothetical protein